MIALESCRGCYDDHYNLPGNSGDGRCWHAKTGRMVTRYAIGTWTVPTQPGAFREVRVPSCYHRTGEQYYDRLPDFVRVEDVVRRKRGGP